MWFCVEYEWIHCGLPEAQAASPAPLPTPTPTPPPTPLSEATPTPTATPMPLLTQAEAEELVFRTISSCKTSTDRAYGATTTVSYSSWFYRDKWRVHASWPTGNMWYGDWTVDSRSGSVTPFNNKAAIVVSLAGRCGLPTGVTPIATTV